jgi:hypothetical protein
MNKNRVSTSRQNPTKRKAKCCSVDQIVNEHTFHVRNFLYSVTDDHIWICEMVSKVLLRAPNQETRNVCTDQYNKVCTNTNALICN